MSDACVQCGDEWPRERMLSLDGWINPPEDPDLVCPRCAIVALRGGPSALSLEEREKYRVEIGGED